ncbi:DUF4097 family beta strand repeat-containing protein [Segetibacter koreensis]|uniref:DUF4097 family beta strand repeat-containing protein n=1 Tax=Segetibacter koreensis TaxID=398037 RepID=UPI00035E78FF|nr:DUF4097 family beta strand repeat-containing protein [Segetibacter koreensis]
MKKLFLHLILAGITISVNAQKETKEPYLSKSFANTSIKDVDVKTSGGSISVAGVDASEARVEVYVNGNKNSDNLSKEDIKRRLEENYDLNISLSNNTLTAIAKPKERSMNWKKGLSISFKVFTPKNVNSDIATSGGSISLTNLSGNQDFSTSGGSLHVDNLSGNVKGRTSGGSIDVTNSKDDISLSTSGGSIHAENCDGNLRLSTSGGSLDLTALKGNIEASTSGGSINGNDIEGELSASTSGGSVHLNNLTCSLEASTSSGSIDISMKSIGKYIKISNSGGNVDLTIPGGKGIDLRLSGNKVSTPALANFNGSMDNNEVEGKLNGGGVPVTVRAGSGKVRLMVQ